ncbi:hypothetical protein [Polyangium jinanense]|uniref:Uncharacterized protein n=1 Tax=Polyangium jinanense TaxID=2829994 RepID=A0A9X4AQH5_9BACT|nr:hypothetical protein [Polyangium jinanense]MDC3953794.1 hypothetical protein [Polyangium jinanense]MDC3979085.1 hypothetical protein [Polyangium jinanense]
MASRWVTRCFVITWLGAFGAGCVDPGREDRALAEIDAVRRESAARETQIRVLEERQAAFTQQMAMVMALAQASYGRDARRDKDDERDQRIAEMAARLARVEGMVSRIHATDVPPEGDAAAARRASEQGSAEERAAAVRKVQALLDSGQVKVTVRGGKVQISLLRPLDAKDPYTGKDAPPPKPSTPPPQLEADMLQWR